MDALGVSWGGPKGRRRPAFPLLAAAVAGAMLLPASATTSSSPQHASVLQQVIVQALPGAVSRAEHAVTAAGGTITRELNLVNGFAATVPAGSGADLGRGDGILAVTPDQPLHVQGASYTPATDAGSPTSLQAATGATTFWQNGYYGQGVGVAVIDSGIVPEDGLRNNVFYGPDFSPQVADPTLKFLDTFGHGTFMASLIGGRTDGASRPYTNSTGFVGIAPEATVISVKVADASGTTTESAVVAGVEWVTQHMYDQSLHVRNIRVINLSVGVPDSGYRNDPLAAAIERAWNYGITVISSVGNDGKSGITLPAADPYDIAVGAVDNQNTLNPADDTVAAFSNTGNGTRNPDLVAPGTHLVGLRDAGGYIDTTYGSTGIVSPTLFRGSGTSEAAAVVSGAAALIISEYPDLNPDVVKALLMESAKPVAGGTLASSGSGQLDLSAAFSHGLHYLYANYPHASTYDTYATNQWGGTWADNIWQAPTYSVTSGGEGGTLSGSHWTGSHWTGITWTGSHWTGATWSGGSWADRTWS